MDDGGERDAPKPMRPPAVIILDVRVPVMVQVPRIMIARPLWAFRLGAGRDSAASGAAQTNRCC